MEPQVRQRLERVGGRKDQQPAEKAPAKSAPFLQESHEKAIWKGNNPT